MSGKTGFSKRSASVSTRWGAAALALASLLALCLLAAPRAEAAWLPPLAVSHEGSEARDPQIAVDAQGDVTVAWVSGTSSQDIFVAEHPAGGQWTNPVGRIAVAEACTDPRLAVDSAGAAIVVADCGSAATEMRAAARTTGGVWSTSVPIPGSGNGEEPRVAMDDSGNSVVVWEASSTVQSNYRKAATGTWEAVPLRASPNAIASHEPDVAISRTGRAIAVWREQTGPGSVAQVGTNSRQGSAAWLGTDYLSGPATSTTPVVSGEPQVTIGAGGRFAAWSQLASPNPPVLKNAWGSASDFGSWGADLASHVSADTGYEVETPRVALDASGRAVAVFRARKIENSDFVVRIASTGFINGGWSPQVTLATGGNGSTQPDVAVDPAGDAIAVWRIGATVSALRRPAGGSFAPPGTPISNSAHTGFEEPRIAMDTGGDGIAVWSAEDTTSLHIAVAVDDVVPPSVSASGPASAQTGSAVTLTATATDTWSPVSLSWDFGDGASAAGASVSHAYATAGTKTATVTATDAAGNHASATVSITVTSPPPPPPPTPPTPPTPVTLAVKVPAQSWKQIAKAKAIKVRCRLDVDGRCAVKADLAAAVATRLGFRVGTGRKLIVIGKGFVHENAGKFATVVVKLTPKALAKIGAATRAVSVKLAITGTATDSGRKPASLGRTLKIARP